jgi:hypothetical protein
MYTLLIIYLCCCAYFIYRRRLTPAKHLQSQHLKTIGEDMEVYKLTWVPSTSSTASTQDVKALVAGVATDVVLGAANTVAEQQFTFSTGAVVEWWVVTYNADKAKTAESAHATFTASDESPLVASTGLASSWVSHS